MTRRARLWLAFVALALATTVVVSRAQSLRVSANRSSAREAQALALSRELRDGQDALSTAMHAVNAGRFDDAERELLLARTLLAHSHEQLVALGRSRESGQVLALLEGIEVARGLIVRMSVGQLEKERAGLTGPQS